MRLSLIPLALLLAACAAPPPEAPTVATGPAAAPQPQVDRVSPATAVSNFRAVVGQVEPVAEAVCRGTAAPGTNCDFEIVVVDEPGLPPNAFQTLGPDGRPVIGFTRSLIADARNRDEIAFVMGHETAHHIEGHISRTQGSAAIGGVLAGVLAQAAGAQQGDVDLAAQLGSEVGARSFSKAYEIEADRLGTAIAARAGYDPLRGVAFFDRLPDPGNRFLGTHPPNASRVAAVRAVAAGL